MAGYAKRDLAACPDLMLFREKASAIDPSEHDYQLRIVRITPDDLTRWR